MQTFGYIDHNILQGDYLFKKIRGKELTKMSEHTKIYKLLLNGVEHYI